MSYNARKLEVEGLPLDITEDHLRVILGNKRKQGGGPIESVELNIDGGSCFAVVTFKESDAVDRILRRGDTVTIDAIQARVKRSHSPDYQQNSTAHTNRFVKNSEIAERPMASSDSSKEQRFKKMHENVRLHPNTPNDTTRSVENETLPTKLYSGPTVICNVIPLCNLPKLEYVNKVYQHSLQIHKFGFEFLKFHERKLKELAHSVHCKYFLSLIENQCVLTVKLDWRKKITAREVKSMLETGINELWKYLEVFKVAQFTLPKSKFQDFFKYYQERCKQESDDMKLFFDHRDSLVVFISDNDEHWLKNHVNSICQEFLCGSNTKLFGSCHGFSTENLTQRQDFGPRHDDKVKQRKRRGKQYTSSDHETGIDIAHHRVNPSTRPKNKEHLQFVKVSNKNSFSVETTTNSPMEETTFEEILELEEKDIILFKVTSFHNEIEKTNEPLHIFLDADRLKVVIKSNDKNKLYSAQVELLKKACDFISINIDTFSKFQMQLLQMQNVQDTINKNFKNANLHAYFKCSTNTATVFYVKGIDNEVLKTFVASQVVVTQKPLDDAMVITFQSEKGRKFLSDLCESCNGLKMSSRVELQGKTLFIIAAAQHHDQLMSAINKFAQENNCLEKCIPFARAYQKYVQEFLKQEMEQIESTMISLGVRIVKDSEIIKIQGLKDGVTEGEKTLTQLKQNIFEGKTALKYFGIDEFLKTTEGRSIVKRVERRRKCIFVQKPCLVKDGATGLQTKPLVTVKLPGLVAYAAIGECTIHFIKGDITDIVADAIINPVESSLQCRIRLGQALISKGGASIQTALMSSHLQDSLGRVIQTIAGSLNTCKAIVHVVCPNYRGTEADNLEGLVSACLTFITRQGHKAVAIPTLGAGLLFGFPVKVACSVLMKSLRQHLKSGASSLREVYLCDFQLEVVSKLIKSFQKIFHQEVTIDGHDNSSMLSAVTVSGQVDFHIYADCHPSAVTAVIDLDESVRNAFKEEKENNEDVKKLNKYQVKQLVCEGKKHCVEVTVNVEEELFVMKSFQAEGFAPVQKLLRTFLLEVMKNQFKELQGVAKSVIQWQFKQTSWMDFDFSINSELESQFIKKSKCHDIADSRLCRYRVDFVAMKEYPLDDNGQPHGFGYEVRRCDHFKDGELPKQWESMKHSENLKLVNLKLGSEEYTMVLKIYTRGEATKPVKKIQRIQNKSLYQQFKAKKREMDHRNGRAYKNEQRLFHGTDEASVAAINENGFNRSFSGKNATVYGKGVYFAVKSSYSIGYAKPSPQGECFMYIARVLTGISTPGKAGMDYLPRQPGKAIPFDSGQAGENFVIFHDSQAYPEYLITL